MPGEAPDRKVDPSDLRAVADRLLAPVAVLGPDTTVLYVNAAAADALGKDAQWLLGRRVIDFVHPEDRSRVTSELRRVSGGRTPGGITTYRLRAGRGGPWRTFETIADNLLDNPIVGGILVSIRDITDQLAHERKLVAAAYHDSLTGLPNRAWATERLEEAVSRRGPLAVAFLGLDGFKLINDSLGHTAGDAVLKVASERLLASLPRTAVVGRFGADVFVVLIRGAAAAQAKNLLWRAVERFGEPLFLAGHELRLSASAGVAKKDSAATADSLLRDADLALHRSKVSGGGRVEVFEPAMREAAIARLALEADLRRAISGHRLSLALQPVIDLDDRSQVGAEALVRWHRPRISVEPSRIVAVAEETGLIVPLGDWVIDRAAQLAPVTLGTRVSVNLSARQLASPGLAGRIARILRARQLPPSCLAFEVTETLLITEFEYAVEVLGSLRDLGCSIGLDDFGTGHSSLGYLRRLPLDFLKLDGSLSDGIDTDGQARAIVGAVLTMANALGLTVVAEHVETEGQAAALVDVGCRFAQGFLFGRPEEP